MTRNEIALLILGVGALWLMGLRLPSWGRYAAGGEHLNGGVGRNAEGVRPEPLRILIDEPLGSREYGATPWWQDNGAWAG